MRFLVLLFSLSLLAFTNTDRADYPKDYFAPPVDYTMRLSGTFGELRANHFHSGIDIKGSIGKEIHSAAEGYIEQIKVQSGGYGNVLYLRHPNGYRTVYAHLYRFLPEIAEFVRQAQEKEQSFEVHLHPDPTRFPVKQGQLIGWMGNSGYSFGPHLHFEIRDAESDIPINPLLFGLKVEDQRSPLINQLRLYGLDKESKTTYTQTLPVYGQGKNYRISGDTVIARTDRVGFAIKTYDLMDAVRNWNGIYSIRMVVDGLQRYQFEMEQFSFDETRYLNAHIDYEDQVTNKSWFNRCFRLPGNQLSAYKILDRDGILEVKPGQAQRVEFIVEDVEGNRSQLGFWVKRDLSGVRELATDYDYFLPFDKENIIDNHFLFLQFPEGSLYENQYLDYQMEEEQSAGYYAPVHSIHDRLVPVHHYFTIGLRSYLIPDHLKPKAFVALCEKDNDIVNCGGRWEEGMLMTKTRSFGDYTIMIDTVPPTIRPEQTSYDLRRKGRISFKIHDNFGAGGTAPGLRYQATIDDQWALIAYDAKYRRLIYQPSEELSAGKHQFKLEVRDAVDNVAVLEETIIR